MRPGATSAEVALLKAKGRSVRAIAEALRISVGSVHGMLKAPEPAA